MVKYVGSLDLTMSQVASICLTGGEEGTSIHLGMVLELKASVFKDPVVAGKLAQTFLLLADKKMARKIELDQRDKESSDLTMEKFEKKVVELKGKENLAKNLAVDEFKASKECKEAVEEETFLYFDEGFNLCKKYFSLRFPNLDIDDMEINPDLAKGDKDAKVDKGGTIMKDVTISIDRSLPDVEF
ncbi:hypothetical protein Acr_00g0030260 [Actinidia rufa]|uniref:Uncharacterized protein n=1 Tax=Actinidia rufa TaxID=165716 RepID=A0A7J0DER0_9ERIC|nr:hypothetical protein Acr_00g0030260 [Actinidia rufa]